MGIGTGVHRNELRCWSQSANNATWVGTGGHSPIREAVQHSETRKIGAKLRIVGSCLGRSEGWTVEVRNVERCSFSYHSGHIAQYIWPKPGFWP